MNHHSNIPEFRSNTSIRVRCQTDGKSESQKTVWTIDFEGTIPTISFSRFSIDASGKGYLECSGVDSISTMANFINML